MKLALLALVVFCTFFGAGALYAHWQLYLPPECRGDIPDQIPFYQGMTLCPGQTAIITIEIPMSPVGGKDI